MWKLTGHPKTQIATKALAEQFQRMEPAIQDRPVSELRLKVYEKIMRAGGFRPMSWAAAHCKETGATYRVNGKHTSLLCSSLPLKEIPTLYAIVEYYECDTLQDVAELYSTYDSKMQARTTRDINAAFASTIPQLAGVDLATITVAVSGISFSTLAGENKLYKRTQPQERAEALFEHHDFVTWLFGLVHKKNSHIKRMPCVAAMYMTWQKAPRIATEFWTLIRDETAATPDHPTRKLARYLMVNSNRLQVRSRSNAQGPRRISDREYFVKCLHAWNAFREEENTNLNYHASKPVPSIK